MKKILKVRKTVNYYVFYNLASAFLISMVINFTMFSDTEKLEMVMNPKNLTMDLSQVMTITIISQLIALTLILILMWLFYRLIYGVLLRKLNKNYKELVKLESLTN